MSDSSLLTSNLGNSHLHDCNHLGQRAKDILARFRAEAAEGVPKIFPHWSALWRMHTRDGHWFHPMDSELDLDWLSQVALKEMQLGPAADTLSALEVNLFRGDASVKTRAQEELDLWRSLGGHDVDAYALLLSVFYDTCPLAAAALDNQDECSLRDQVLVHARHAPTMQRLALEFQCEWQSCRAKHQSLAQAWILEQENFRRMGPLHARSFIDESILTEVHDACCQEIVSMTALELRDCLIHLVLWAAEFYWPDVLRRLRDNRHLASVLKTSRFPLVPFALAWSRIRPDSFITGMAIWLMRSEQALDRLAGATVWQRCHPIAP